MLLIEAVVGEECALLTNASVAYAVYAATSAAAACAGRAALHGVLCEHAHALEYVRRLARHYGVGGNGDRR